MVYSQVFLLLSLVVFSCWGSIGDRSHPYQNCLFNCVSNCDNRNKVFTEKQAMHLQLLGWDCSEECKYECMWTAVEVFQKSNLSTPQFHGKWPFIRLAGIQEPASVLFSVCNGVTVWLGFKNFYKYVPRSAPMYKLVVFHFLLAENAWFWSVIYHSRDFSITEKLDYFSATSIVLFTLYFCIYRATFFLHYKSHKYIRWFAAKIILMVYFGHVSYLSFVKFDYGYNMVFNVACGLTSCMLCILFWLFNRNTLPYAWKIPTISVLTSLLLCFETLDFPPWLWIFDAHSIWHMSTIPVPLLMYSFVIDDQLYLINSVY